VRDAHAILRLIAVQFIDLPEGHNLSRYNLSFSEVLVLKYLDDISGGNRSIVLLIDELNTLRVINSCIRLVSGTHVPMDIDIAIDQLMETSNSNLPPSPRGYIPLPMPFCTDVVKMRSMFMERSIVVTPAQVALYNCIPSLLYCALLLPIAAMTPSDRVVMITEQTRIKAGSFSNYFRFSVYVDDGFQQENKSIPEAQVLQAFFQLFLDC
jgi:hypothetical protein